jgi:Anthranilate/para-aminobenzoate synthases component I
MTALAAHPKERAEHIMLIDLERNDLGRVCDPGTVQVDELMTIESYAHVHHIVSNVSGLLRPDVTPVEALRAVFPGGTITGCPKFRCMQLIAELEGWGAAPTRARWVISTATGLWISTSSSAP